MHPRERVLSDLKMCRLAGKEPTPELQQRAKKWGVEWPKPPERIRDTHRDEDNIDYTKEN